MASFYPSRKISGNLCSGRSAFTLIMFIVVGLSLAMLPSQKVNGQNTLDLAGLTSASPSTAAFGLRKLSSAYNGAAILVRRNNNDTLAIGFDANGNLDTVALKNFIGTGSGFVKVWYDQSGNNRHAMNSTAANQPRIALNGVIDYSNGRPTVSWQNTAQLLTGASGVFQTVSAVRNLTDYSGTNFQTLFNVGNDFSIRRGYGEIPNINGNDWISGTGNPLANWINGVQTTVGPFPLHSLVAAASSPRTNTFSISVNNAGRGLTAGNVVSELITFQGTITATERQNLQCAQGQYYSFASEGILQQLPLTVCSGSGFQLNTTGATYTWSAPVISPAGAITGGAAQTTPVASIGQVLTNTSGAAATATYTVTPVYCGVNGAPFNVTVTVSATSSTLNTITQTTCSGVAFSATSSNAPAGTTYSWSSPTISPAAVLTGFTPNSNRTALTQTLVNSTVSDATATYLVYAKTSVCAATVNAVVTVKGTFLSQNRPTLGVCSGSTVTYIPDEVRYPVGTTVTWSVPGTVPAGLTGMSSGTTQPEFTQTLVNTTNTDLTLTYTLTPKLGSCTGTNFTIPVKVQAAPSLKPMSALEYSVCNDNNTFIVIDNSDSTFQYQLYDAALPDGDNLIDTAVIGTGGTILLNTGNLSTATRFYVVVTNPATGCQRTLADTITINVNSNPVPVVSVTTNYCLGNGQVKITSGEPHQTYAWSNGATTPDIIINQSGIYTLTVTDASTGTCKGRTSIGIGDELIPYNDGNFNNGFYSAQSDLALNSNLTVEGRWYVAAEPRTTHNNFWGRDHTTGNGKMMIINGGNNPTTKIWYKTISNIQPNTLYYFSGWALSMNNRSPFARISFKINGNTVGTSAALAPGVETPTGNTGWQRFFGQWYSGDTSTVELSIANLQTSAGGNDFALDDLSFSTLPPVTIEINGKDTTACLNSSFIFPVQQQGGNSPLTYTWTGPNGYTTTSSVPIINNIDYSSSGLYTVSITDGRGCTSKLDSAMIRVWDTLKINAAPVEQLACIGTNVTFSVNASALDQTLTYQWQVSNNGGAYTNAGGTSTLSTYTVSPSLADTGRLYRVLIKGAAPCGWKYTDPKKVNVKNVWLGKVSSDWNDPANWNSNAVPDMSCANVYIMPSPNAPVLNSTTSITNLNVQPGGALTITNLGVLKIAGSITSPGLIEASEGTIEFNRVNNSQTISGKFFVGSKLGTLILSNNNTTTISTNADSLRITNALLFTSGSKLTTNNSLVLTSTATRTARIGKQAAANTITGEVTVERYIPAGRKWRLLSVPTNTTQSFRKAWMENATNVGATVPAGYGTQITSHYAAWNSLGFDAYSAGGSSVKVYDPATALYVGIKSPDSLMKTTGGYMTFIRGDRSAGVSGNNVAATILRTKGTIYQSTNTVTANRPSAVTIPATKLATVGNPFASAIDLRNITMANTTGTIYVWDANLTQGYGLGAFQTLIKIGGNYVTTPGNVVMNTIQSGQAFFVQATGTQGTVSFDENSKSDETAGTSVFRIPGVDQQLMVDLHLGTDAVLLDGVRAIYGDEYSNNVDYGDAPKLPNTSENVSIKRNNSLLAIERRADITNEDTLFLNLAGVRYATDYKWTISASNLDETGRIGWLVDKFTNTQTQLDLTGSTDYTFSITTAANSYAANRFMIVFKQSVVLPVTMTAVAATRNANKTVTVSWKSETEINIAKYTVEQSNDGRTFSAIGIAAPTNNNAGNASYSTIDANASAAINYYRINALGRDGKIQYSAIVKVDALNIPATGSITVYPNPVVDKTLNISFKNKSFGDYNLELISNNGQVVYKGVVTVGSANVMKTIRLNASVAAGVYRLRAIGKDNAVFTTQLIIE